MRMTKKIAIEKARDTVVAQMDKQIQEMTSQIRQNIYELRRITEKQTILKRQKAMLAKIRYDFLKTIDSDLPKGL